MFSYPALPAGEPSRRNWYQDLLDDPGCRGDPVKVQEAYLSQREQRFAEMSKDLKSYADDIELSGPDKQKPYAKLTLVSDSGRLTEKSVDDPLNCRELEINCMGFWARPTVQVQRMIASIFDELADLLGDAIFPVPEAHRHLSVIEFSHRHQQVVLEEVKDQLTLTVLESILGLPQAKRGVKEPICLVQPMISFDPAGIALCFVPAVVNSPSMTYHDLRNESQKLALSKPIKIDTCYTAATAHIAIARFVKEPFVNSSSRSTSLTGAEKAREFLNLLDNINAKLRATQWSTFTWQLITELGLELQMGYLKFGRERELAALTGDRSDA